MKENRTSLWTHSLIFNQLKWPKLSKNHINLSCWDFPLQKLPQRTKEIFMMFKMRWRGITNWIAVTIHFKIKLTSLHNRVGGVFKLNFLGEMIFNIQERSAKTFLIERNMNFHCSQYVKLTKKLKRNLKETLILSDLATETLA